MSILPIDRRKAADIVHDRIKEMILSKQWAPETRIPSEASLCEMFGVSRVTIREATHRLTGQGLLSVRQGDGTYVARITAGSLLKSTLPLMTIDETSLSQALEYRVLLEVESARLAAIRATPEDIGLLHAVLDEQRKGNHSIESTALLDQLFHESITKASGNQLMCATLELLQDIILRNIATLTPHVGTEDTLLYHWMILDAITEHRPEDAASSMRTHIQRTVQGVLY